MRPIGILAFAPPEDIERFRAALVAVIEERDGEGAADVRVIPSDALAAADPERLVIAAVDASREALRQLWRAGEVRADGAVVPEAYVIVRREVVAFGDPDPARALPMAICRLLGLDRPDPARLLADVSVTDTLAGSAARTPKAVFQLREADGLDAPTTREAAALEGHYRALVDRLSPTERRQTRGQTPRPTTALRLSRSLLDADGRPAPDGIPTGITLLVAPSGAGKSSFVAGLHRPVLSLRVVSRAEKLARLVEGAALIDGRLCCVFDDFEACPAWLAQGEQAAFADDLTEALIAAGRARGATSHEIVLAVRPSEHVDTLAKQLARIGAAVERRTLAPLDAGESRAFAQAALGADAGVLLRRLDEIGVTAHRTDLRFFADVCERWRVSPDFTVDPVRVMRFSIDRRLESERAVRAANPATLIRLARLLAFAMTLTNRLRFADAGAPYDPACLSGTELAKLDADLDVSTLRLLVGDGGLLAQAEGAADFVHESDREFLAAEYLSALPAGTVEGWLVAGHGADGRVPFALRGVARWLLLIAPAERRKWLLAREPGIVVDALPALQAAPERAELEALVEAHRAGRLPIWQAERYGYGPAERLGTDAAGYVCELLSDPDASLRRFAAGALGRGATEGVAVALLDRALDPEERSDVREVAAYGVVESDVSTAVRGLEPLLDLPVEADPHHELRGIALSALWPRFIDAGRLFAALTPWPTSYRFGAYHAFFSEPAVPLSGLRAQDLGVALPWATERIGDPSVPWVGPHDGSVVHAFALELARRVLLLRRSDDLAPSWVELCVAAIERQVAPMLHRPDDAELWRAAIVAVVERSTSARGWDELPHSGVLTRSDLDWLILQARRGGPATRRWVELSIRFWDPLARPDLFDAVHSLPDAVTLAPYWFRPMALDSDEARRAKDWYETSRRPALPEPDSESESLPAPGVREVLARAFEAPGGGWQVLHHDALCRGEWRRLHDGSVDAFKLPGAPLPDSPEAAALLDAAFEFCASVPATPERWSRQNGRRPVDFAAMRAFGTLAAHQPERLRSLAAERLGAWAPLAVEPFPAADRGPWLRLLWAVAQPALRGALLAACGLEHAAGAVRRVLEALDASSSADLAVDLLNAPGISADTSVELLHLLFRLGATERARNWARGRLDWPGVEVALVAFDPEPAHLRDLLARGQADDAARLLSQAHRWAGWRAGRLPSLERLYPAERATLADAHLSLAANGDDLHTHSPFAAALLERLVTDGEAELIARLALKHPALAIDAERARIQAAQRAWRPQTIESLVEALHAAPCVAEGPVAASAHRTGLPRGEMEHLFTWLHLSDLHFGQGAPDYADNRALVLGALRQSLADLGRPGGPPKPDCVLVTGDIAFSGGGLGDEYGPALVWFREVVATVGLSLTDVFGVPGNHDVDRGRDKKDPDVAMTLSAYRDAQPLNAIWFPTHTTHLDRLRARQAAYQAFAAQLAPGTGEPFWIHRRGARGGLKIRLVGLNSALLAADDQDAGRLEIGDRQRRLLLEPPPEAGELIVALQHHPVAQPGLPWLKTDEDREHDRWLAGHTHLLLCGHVHDPALDVVHGSGAARAHYRLVAGAAHDEKSVPRKLVRHAYNVASVARDAAGALWLRVWPRVWSPKNADFRLDTDSVPPGAQFVERPLVVHGFEAGVGSATGATAPAAIGPTAQPVPVESPAPLVSDVKNAASVTPAASAAVLGALQAAVGQSRLVGPSLSAFLTEAAGRWPREADARRLVEIAGLSASRIDFAGDAQARWFAVYAEAVQAPDGLARLVAAMVPDV